MPGEVDENGALRKVCVLPKPWQKPYPPVFVAASKSRDSIEFCAKHGFRPVYFMSNKGIFELSEVYVEEARKHGFDFRLGERQAIVRWPHITRTQAEFDDKLRRYDLDVYKNFYGPFFPYFPQSDEDTLIESMKESEIFIGGTIDESIRQWRVIYDRVPAEYITLIWHWAEQPKDDMLEELRLFMDKVLPELEIPDFGKQAEA